MALTQLDAVAALVLIDLQKGIVSRAPAETAPEVVDRAARLADAFRKRNLPVVLVNVTGLPPGRRSEIFNFQPPPDWADLAPELGQQGSDIRITKRSPGAFAGTALDAELRKRGVTQIFLSGISTTMRVESTGRTAFDLGYNVVFVTDAMTDRDQDMHLHAIQKVFGKYGETTTSEEVLRVLKA